ncbi:MAG: hypothetical protein II013_07345 [Lachnobacterium sp.]|nr:hypothetical protein [Lachnobacterium sp.]
MQVIFDTKILKQLEKEIDDYYEDYTSAVGMVTNEVIDRTLGMRSMVKRIREIIMEES